MGLNIAYKAEYAREKTKKQIKIYQKHFYVSESKKPYYLQYGQFFLEKMEEILYGEKILIFRKDGSDKRIVLLCSDSFVFEKSLKLLGASKRFFSITLF